MVIFVSVFGLAAGSLFGQNAPLTPKITADAARCFQIDQQIADLAILATEKLLDRELANKSDQQRFVAEFLASAGSKGK